MKIFTCFKAWSTVILIALLESGIAAPTVTPDSYTATEDTALVLAAPGVLENDIGDPVGSTLNSSIVTPPSHGTVLLQADGSFNYTPAANYAGTDSFTYLAQGSRMFTVDRARSIVNVKATGTIPLGTSTDNKNGNMIGSAKVYLNPAAPPSQQIQIQDLDLALDSRITLQLRWAFGLYSLNADIDPTRTTDPDFMRLNLDQPGPVTNVASDGTFTQTGNTMTTTGRAQLSGNAPGVTIPPTLDINSTAPYDFAPIAGETALGGPSITVVGSNLELRIPMKVTQTVVDPSYTIVVEVKGVMFATAPINPLPGSGTATVSLNILPVNDEPAVANDKYYTRQNFPLSIPATAATTTQSLIDAGGVWKWSTGTDLGTNWRTWSYNDTSWAFGGAQLGYGDGDEITLIDDNPTPGYSNSPAPTDRYPTAYFRKEFILTSPFDTIQPQFEILRDDAAAIYINGTEIYRDSDPYTTGGTAPLPASPATISYATLSTATVPDEAAFRSTGSGGAVLSFSRSLLLEGRNVIAVEVHQTGAAGVVNSSDMSFDFKLKRTRGVAGLIANDTDVDGDVLGAQLFIPPSHGSATVETSGAFVYTPAAGFHGTDTFTYRVTEGGVPATREVVVIKPGSESVVGTEPVWQYLDNGVYPGNTWKDPAFDDSAWPVGPAELGYGDGDERHVIEDNPTPGYSNSPVPTDRYITSYFRKSVTLTDITKLSALRIRLKRDDGAAVYVNGTKVMLSNLVDSAGHTTLASASIGGTDENLFIEQMVTNLSMLQEGTNTIAVEVHQSAPDSSDLSFDLGLSAIYAVTGQVTMEVLDDDIDDDLVSDTWERSFGIDASFSNADADPDKDGQSNRAEFLAGTNPLSNASAFRVGTAEQLNPTTLQFEFESVPGKTYQMEVLTEGIGWQNQGSPFPAHATNPRTSVQLTKPATARKMYRFRVVGDWQ